MKLFALITASLLATAGIAPAASAQERVVVQHDRTVVRHGHGWKRHQVRRVCRTEWRHHQRVRICRTVRR